MSTDRAGKIDTDGKSIFIDIDRSKGANYSRDGTHELVHAEQFEDGKLRFRFDDGDRKWWIQNVTIQSEVEAYTKQTVKNPMIDYDNLENDVKRYYPGLINNTEVIDRGPITKRQIVRNKYYFGIIYPQLPP